MMWADRGVSMNSLLDASSSLKLKMTPLDLIRAGAVIPSDPIQSLKTTYFFQSPYYQSFRRQPTIHSRLRNRPPHVPFFNSRRSVVDFGGCSGLLLVRRPDVDGKTAAQIEADGNQQAAI